MKRLPHLLLSLVVGLVAFYALLVAVTPVKADTLPELPEGYYYTSINLEFVTYTGDPMTIECEDNSTAITIVCTNGNVPAGDEVIAAFALNIGNGNLLTEVMGIVIVNQYYDVTGTATIQHKILYSTVGDAFGDGEKYAMIRTGQNTPLANVIAYADGGYSNFSTAISTISDRIARSSGASGSSTGVAWADNIYVIVQSDTPPPSEGGGGNPPDWPFPFAASCPVVTTCTVPSADITNTVGITPTGGDVSNTYSIDACSMYGITNTGTITDPEPITDTTVITASYTVSTNLLSNWSFEENDGVKPLQWQPVKNSVVWDGSYLVAYSVEPAYANTGAASVNNADNFDFVFDLSFPVSQTSYSGVAFQAGGYVRCNAATCENQGVSVKWNGLTVVSSGELSDTYALISGTSSSGGGNPQFSVSFSGGDASIGYVYFDDAYVIPTDEETGDLLCSADFYEPMDETSDDGNYTSCLLYPNTGECLPVGSGGAGVICYECQFPTPDLPVQYWIAWLGCLIRNLFSCSLRVWLLVLGNWARGQIQYMIAFAAWIPFNVQAGANWFAGTVVPALRVQGVTIIEQGTNWLDVLIALFNIYQTILAGIFDVVVAIIGLVATALPLLFQLLFSIFDLIRDLGSAVQVAFTAQPTLLDLNGTTQPGTLALAADGPNDSKILWLFFAGAAIVDQMVFNTEWANTLLSVVIGALSLLVALWLYNWWRDILDL